MVVSSVSPERWDTTTPKLCFCAKSIASIVSDTLPIWLSLIKIAFMAFEEIAFSNLTKFVTVKSSPTNCTFFPNSEYKFCQPDQSF